MLTSVPIFLHVGLMKTGTSYLQSIFWNSQDELAAQGLALVPSSKRDTFNLMLDVRDRYRPESDRPSVTQALARLPDQLASASGSRVLISQESLSAATPQQAARLVGALVDRELHLVVTVRDIARQIPSSWQQELQSGRDFAFERYVASVVAGERRPARTFWTGQDVLGVLDRWGSVVPGGRVHVVTVPQSGSDSALLLDRFCSLLGVEASRLATDVARSNTSLGRVQAEVLRRVNQQLPAHARRRDLYGDVGKRFFAAGVLGKQDGVRALVPREHQAWCLEHAELVIAGIRERGHHIVGDLADLRPVASSFGDDDQTASPEQVADSATAALATVLEQRMARVERTRKRSRVTERRRPRRWRHLLGSAD